MMMQETRTLTPRHVPSMGLEASECVTEHRDHNETQEILQDISGDESLAREESLAPQQ